MRAAVIVGAMVIAACGTVPASPAGASLIVQPEAARPRCVAGGGDTTRAGFFEFQVERTADPRIVPAQPGRPGPETALLQFVVDTAGLIELPTVKVIEPGVPVSAELKAAAATWRFTPAEVYGCKVRQVVQIAVWRSIL